jgi:hypothetical protein
MSRLRARTYDRSQLPPGAQPRRCDHPDCREAGEYRAPRSRNALREYYWFCLEHVRSYNAAWDFFRGMGPDEIERFRRADVVGGRPSWPLGARGPKGFHYELGHEQLHEALKRFFFDEAEPRPRRVLTAQEEALAVLSLDISATAAEIKARYKELVKRHHPDANGGDKAAEDRLKTINQAYTLLKSIRTPAARQDAAE